MQVMPENLFKKSISSGPILQTSDISKLGSWFNFNLKVMLVIFKVPTAKVIEMKASRELFLIHDQNHWDSGHERTIICLKPDIRNMVKITVWQD